MMVSDEIDFDLATFRYGNIASSRHAGIELTVDAAHGRWLSPSLFYAWSAVSPRSGPYVDRQLKNIPRHVWRPGVDVRAPFGLHVGARYTATRGAFLDDENTLPLRPARSLDVRVDKTVRRLRAFADFTNLTDVRFEEYGYVLTDRA